MNRKQVGFDVISENVGNGADKQILLGRVQRYLDEGWEVLNTHVPQTGSGAITITVVFVKYEVFELDAVLSGSDSTSKKSK